MLRSAVLFERQKRLLALVDAAGDNVSKLDFQKLLFLYCSQVEDKPSYEFIPYRFGAFSFTSHDDRRRLVQKGLLENDERLWKLTAGGRKAAVIAPAIRMRMDRFAQRHAGLRGDELVAETYKSDPYYAINSEIAERVLAGDAAALKGIEQARPAKQNPRLLTIGYEGRTLEAYVNRLLHAGVTLLCDVRRNAFSRKYGFSKRTLATVCNHVRIRYEHLPGLGIDSEERRVLQSPSDYKALFASYVQHMLPNMTSALEQIRGWVNEGERVALTCFELVPYLCHRHCVADELVRRWGKELAAEHL